MAANMKKNNYNVSPLKNSQVCIPNGFKSQDQLRPWNKMISRKKIDSPPSTGEGTWTLIREEGLQTNGHSHLLAQPAHINSSGSARQSLQECFSRNFHVRSKPPPSERNHSLNTSERLSKICRTIGDCRSANHSFLSDDDDVDCNELSNEAPKSPPAPCNGDLLNQSEGSDVLSFSKYVGINSTSALPSTIRHPNKAVCTIDAKSSQILTANEMACALFGYDRADMIRKRLIDLIQLKKKDEKTIMESYLQPNGEVIGITGKVVDAIDKNGLVLPVSLWMKRLDYNKKSRCLVAMEPAHRLVCSMFFDIKGTILTCDEKLSHLYGFTDPEDLVGLNINQLIPNFRLPNSSYRISKNVKKQRATGRSLDGSVFPLSVHVQSVAMSSSCEDDEGGTHKSCCRKLSKSEEMYEAIVCVFSSITGLITFFPDGTIHSVNHHFALMLFGYSSVELVGKNVSLLIPEFYSIISTNVPDKVTPISPVNSSMTRSSIGEMFSPNKMKKKGTKLHCPELTAAEKRRFSDITFDHRLAAKERQSRLSKGLKPKDSSTPYRISGRLKLNEISDNSFEDLRMPFEHLPRETVPYDPQCSDIESSSGDEFQPSPVSLTKDSVPHIENGFDCKTELCKDFNNSCESKTKPKSERTLANQDLPLFPAAVNSSSEKPNSTEKVLSAEISRSSKIITCLSAEDSESKENLEKNLIKKSLMTDDCVSSSAGLSPKKNCNNDDHPSTEAMVKLEPELALIDAKMEALCVDCESSLTGYSSADTEDEDNETSKTNVSVCSPIRLPTTKRATNVLPPKGLCLGEENFVPSTDSSLPNVIRSQNESLTQDCDEASVSWKYTKIFSPRKRFSEKTKVERMIASPETLDSDEDSFEFFEREIEKKYQSKELLPGGHSLDLDSDEDGINLQSKKHSSVANSLNNAKPICKSNAFPKKINVTPETEQAPEIESNLQQLSGVGEKKAAENYHKAALRNSLLQRHNRSINSNGVTELEDLCVQENLSPLDENVDGHFAGVCQHKDASLISINFSVNPMHLETGELMFCLWVSQDLNQSSLNNFTLDIASSSNDDSMGISDSQVYTSSSPGGGKTAEVIEESYPPCKAFDANYQNLRTVGHGAFGFVVESLEQSTKLEVIVKYILRSKVLSENWRDDPVLGRIPLEVSLLSHISHPNIVQVLNVFFNKEYVLMVMEKHGTGMDLFEFIEHKPVMDEGLYSYIFRQLVSAIAYLHRSGIVHRDIKDENIIVNEHFHIKLIDFGSAAYMEPGEMFATFCGTVEYCSPEVLMGNWYDGPELEVWSMGVTLYTLVYGENPFFTVDDILACNFKPPFPVSDYLTNLLCLMLLPEPSDRITVEELETDGWVFQPVDMTQYSWQEVMALSDGPTVPEYEVVYDELSSYEDSLRLNCIHTMPSIPSPSTRFKSRLHFRSY